MTIYIVLYNWLFFKTKYYFLCIYMSWRYFPMILQRDGDFSFKRRVVFSLDIMIERWWYFVQYSYQESLVFYWEHFDTIIKSGRGTGGTPIPRGLVNSNARVPVHQWGSATRFISISWPIRSLTYWQKYETPFVWFLRNFNLVQRMNIILQDKSSKIASFLTPLCLQQNLPYFFRNILSSQFIAIKVWHRIKYSFTKVDLF